MNRPLVRFLSCAVSRRAMRSILSLINFSTFHSETLFLAVFGIGLRHTDTEL